MAPGPAAVAHRANDVEVAGEPHARLAALGLGLGHARPERAGEVVAEGHVAPAGARLGLLLVAAAVLVGDDVAHVDDASVEVDVLPAKSADLALAHAGVERDGEGGVGGRRAGGVEEAHEPRAVGGVEGVGLRLLELGGLDSCKGGSA